MASDDRFYLLEFRNRPAKWGDIGSALRIHGLVVGGNGASAVLMLPGLELLGIPSRDPRHAGMPRVLHLSEAEWSDFIRRSDDPEILVGPAKIFQRKLRYEISGAVQQKIWAHANFSCMYCGRKMGEVALTVDHFWPLESGSKNDSSNFISACRRCNKSKGNEDPKDFCDRIKPGLYAELVEYLKARRL